VDATATVHASNIIGDYYTFPTSYKHAMVSMGTIHIEHNI